MAEDTDLYFPLFDDFDLSPSELALASFLMRLDFIADRVRQEVHACDDELTRYARLGEFIRGELEAGIAGAASLTAPFLYTSALARAEIEEAAARMSAECCAGSAVMMLDDIFQRLRRQVWDDERNEPRNANFRIGSIGASSASTIIYAAGNAYRHLRDWGPIVGYDGSCEMELLEKRPRETLLLLGEGIDLVAVYRNMVCCFALDALCGYPAMGRSFENLFVTLQAAAKDFAAQYCDGEASIGKVLEALEDQVGVLNMDFSYAGDREVFGDKQ